MSDKPHIMIVEDDRDIAEPFGKYLEMNGFTVCYAEGEPEALHLAAEERPDLALLDITLRTGDGFSVCRQLQKTNHVPVIFMTGNSQDTDRIVGLEIGADDYVVKPFNPRELIARVKAVLRRANPEPRRVTTNDYTRVSFGSCTLDTAQQTLTNARGETVPLSTGEMRLLQVFLQNPHIVLSREALLDATKGRHFDVFDRSIDNCVARLRKKVEENPRSPRLIKTYWGGGYMLSCEVDHLH
ncbi:response regulator [Kordiimonas aestuarii]|uniref:response regulator n=1 Tax=Kordiimonas aestuarii TaxID=1005925 RepID=UPI0021D2370B|nr:response regulator transcription factor [Kordiimonas aestuarii]